MTLHLSLPGSHHRSSDHQHELREARRLLGERIRNDWEYPTLPPYRSCGKREPETEQDTADAAAGFRFHTPQSRGEGGGSGIALGLEFDPVEWREREYSDLDVSDTETEGPTPTSSKSKKSEYKFDGPDSVGQQLIAKRETRKRKRQLALQAEMECNDGLTHWMRRRDIWCSARNATEIRMLEHGQEASEQDDGDSASASDSTMSRPSTAASSTEEDPEPSTTPESTPSVSPDIATGLSMAPAIRTPFMDVLVPIAPPLLPNHPIRRRINPNTYPEIYSKIILQSRSPSIPINLKTLISALVQGWKDDGEWPPKTGPLEKSIGRKKGAREGSFKDNLRSVGRILKITGTNEVG